MELTLKKKIMASKRYLKKGIEYLYADIVGNYACKKSLHPEVDTEKLFDALSTLLDEGAKFKARVGKTDGKKDPKLVKAYYARLIDNLCENIKKNTAALDQLFK